MQAYASAEMAPAAELRLIDRHPPISGSTSQAAVGNLVFDEMLAHLAEIVAAKVIERLARQVAAADDWLDTRGASEYLGIHRDSLVAWPLSERFLPSRRAPVASCSAAGRTWTPGGVEGRRRWSASGAGTMADSSPAPRRVRVERAIYCRSTGVLEVCFRDENGRLRWRTVDGGILAAHKLRDDLSARRARGESVAANPKLRFGEAADRWLNGPVLDLRDTTQVKYRSIVNGHVRPRFDTNDSLPSPQTIWRGWFGNCAPTARARRPSGSPSR